MSAHDAPRPAPPARHHDGADEADPQSHQPTDDDPRRRDGPRRQCRQVRAVSVEGGHDREDDEAQDLTDDESPRPPGRARWPRHRRPGRRSCHSGTSQRGIRARDPLPGAGIGSSGSTDGGGTPAAPALSEPAAPFAIGARLVSTPVGHAPRPCISGRPRRLPWRNEPVAPRPTFRASHAWWHRWSRLGRDASARIGTGIERSELAMGLRPPHRGRHRRPLPPAAAPAQGGQEPLLQVLPPDVSSQADPVGPDQQRHRRHHRELQERPSTAATDTPSTGARRRRRPTSPP